MRVDRRRGEGARRWRRRATSCTRASRARRTASSRSSTTAGAWAASSSGRSCLPPSPRLPAHAARRRRRHREGAGAGAPRQDAARQARDGHAHRRAPEGVARSHPLQRAQGLRHEPDAPSERARELSPARRQDRAPARGVRQAQGARPPQVELPRHREPRASHAAHVDHRLQRDADRGARRRARARAAGVRQDDPRQGRAAPLAHHEPARYEQARERHDAADDADRGHRARPRRGRLDAHADGAQEGGEARARSAGRSSPSSAATRSASGRSS